MPTLRNYSAGPGALPATVLRHAAQAVAGLPESGLSILGLSHRTPTFRAMVDEAEQRVARLLGLSEDWRVLFLQGGGTLQFSMVPLAMLPKGRSADYIVGGYWSRKSIEAAACHGDVRAAWDGASSGYATLPATLPPRPSAAYLHYVNNETVEGLRFAAPPRTDVPLVVDMSSDFLSCPLDPSPFSLIYAHAQKNLGPAGVTIVCVRRSVLDASPPGLPPILDYRAHAEARSILHTPPVFSIYVVLLLLRWLEDDIGGLEAMGRINQQKAEIVYGALAEAPFFQRHAAPEVASPMNVTFRCPTAALDDAFVAGAEAAGLIGTEGHRSLKGLRISLYNGVTLEDAEVVADYLRAFAKAHA